MLIIFFRFSTCKIVITWPHIPKLVCSKLLSTVSLCFVWFSGYHILSLASCSKLTKFYRLGPAPEWRDWGEGSIKILGGHKNFVFSNSRVKTKKMVFTTESAKNRSLLTDSGLMVSILGVSGLELYSSGYEPVTIFGAQSWLWGAQFSFGGHKQWFGGGARPRNAPPVALVQLPLIWQLFLGFRTLNCGQIIDR